MDLEQVRWRWGPETKDIWRGNRSGSTDEVSGTSIGIWRTKRKVAALSELGEKGGMNV